MKPNGVKDIGLQLVVLVPRSSRINPFSEIFLLVFFCLIWYHSSFWLANFVNPQWTLNSITIQFRRKCIMFIQVVNFPWYLTHSINSCSGRGMQNVVLCIQPMDSADVTEKRNFSAESAKDYKRGRAYLVDIANQHHVPVFSRLEVALNRVLDKVKGTWVWSITSHC